MNEKPVPEFMMRYMENIGYECFGQYEGLSRQYHKEIAHYHENVHPGKMEVDSLYRRTSGQRTNFDGSRQLYEIEENYKAKALENACKHGYILPEHDTNTPSKELTDVQERGAFSRVLDQDDFGLSPEDKRAKIAHSSFEARNKITPEAKQQERALIEMYYGESKEAHRLPGPQQVGRYLSSLSSEKEKNITPESPSMNRSHDKKSPDMDKIDE